MKVITGTRKTTKLMFECHKTNGYMVVRDRKTAREVFTQAQKMDLRGFNFPLTYDEFIAQRYYGKGVKAFFIDDVEVLLSAISPVVPVKAFTISQDTQA